MNTVDLSGLIKGLMVVITIAVIANKLPELKQWALEEAFGHHSTHQSIQREKARNERTSHAETRRNTS